MSAVTSSSLFNTKDDREIKKTIAILQSRSMSYPKGTKSIHQSPRDENIIYEADPKAAEVKNQNSLPEPAKNYIPNRISIKNSRLAIHKDLKLPKIAVRNHRNHSESTTNIRGPIKIKPSFTQLIKALAEKSLTEHIPQPKDTPSKSQIDSADMGKGMSDKHSLVPPHQSNTDKMLDLENNLIDSYKRRSRLSSQSYRHTAEWPAKQPEKMTYDHSQMAHNFSFACHHGDKGRHLSITLQKADDSLYNVRSSQFDQKIVRSSADIKNSRVEGNLLSVSYSLDRQTPGLLDVQMKGVGHSRGYTNILEPLAGSNDTLLSPPQDTADNDQTKNQFKQLFENAAVICNSSSKHNPKEEMLCKVLEEKDLEDKLPKIAQYTKNLLRLPNDMIKKTSKGDIDDHLGVIKEQNREHFELSKTEKLHLKGKNCLILQEETYSKDSLEIKLNSNTPKSKEHNRSFKQHYLSPSSTNLNSLDIARRKKTFNAKKDLFEKVNSSSISNSMSP